MSYWKPSRSDRLCKWTDVCPLCGKGSEIIGVVNWLICWDKKRERRPPLLAQLCFLPPSIFTVSLLPEIGLRAGELVPAHQQSRPVMAEVFREWLHPWDFRWSLIGHSLPARFVIGHSLPCLLLSCVSPLLLLLILFSSAAWAVCLLSIT